MKYKGILFDKDGTLFDFQGSWGIWAHKMFLDLAEQNMSRARTFASSVDFDMETRTFAPESVAIAGTLSGIAQALASVGAGEIDMLTPWLRERATHAEMLPPLPLRPLLSELRAKGYILGVATNDAAEPARAHLKRAGVISLFDFIAGYDSGYGAKPDPGMCNAFADENQLMPNECVMVGDSLHDLLAGQNAGFDTVGVLTGVADRMDLTPHATVVIKDIGELPAWLARA